MNLLTDTRIKFHPKRDFQTSIVQKRLSRKSVYHSSKEPWSQPTKWPVVDRKKVSKVLESSSFFQKGKYTSLADFVPSLKKRSRSLFRVQDGKQPLETQDSKLASEMQEGKQSSDMQVEKSEMNTKETEFDSEYGVGFQILRQNGYHYGIGLGRKEQGNPTLLSLKNKTSFGEEPNHEAKQWTCDHCNVVNENLRLSCHKCCTNRSFYEEASNVDY